MRIFPQYNQATNCSICGTKKKGKALLISIDGTNKGKICKCEQVHLDCINLRYNKEMGILYQDMRDAVRD